MIYSNPLTEQQHNSRLGSKTTKPKNNQIINFLDKKTMKKILFLALIAMFAAQMASAADVYVSTGTSATKYHKVKDCPGLNNTTATIKKVTESEAKNMGRTKCARCWSDAVKTATKKETTKKAEKKTTTKKETTAKKSTPARDEKGRFIKKDAEEKSATAKKATKKTTKKTAEKKETTAKKSTPARDEKGRFIKKDAKEKKATTKKATKKTVKEEAEKDTKKAAKKATKKTTKKSTPERDEKGRFVKKTAE